MTLFAEMFSTQLDYSAFMLFYETVSAEEYLAILSQCNSLSKRVVMLNVYQQVYVCFKNYLVNNRREFQNNP